MNIDSHQALDIYDVEHVEVEIQDRFKPSGQKVLYVHADGITVLRLVMTSMTTFKISDKTEPPKPGADSYKPPMLTCHSPSCRHQQPRRQADKQICEKCGSEDVWL